MSELWRRRLGERRIWERILRERLSEPLHLNLLSLPVALFGSFRSKVYWDLVVRQQHAFGLLNAADKARELGIRHLTAVEFGVANGAGLLNICDIAKRITAETGVRWRVFGFDSGAGMPAPRDHRDHPELYSAGNFPMQDRSVLEGRLPDFASLIIGDLTETAPAALTRISPDAPLGFASIDVDYYSSTLACLEFFLGDPACYLPTVDVYADDVMFETHSRWGGEILAIIEFNEAHEHRKIESHRFIREKRLFKRPNWLSHMHTLHVLDHPARQPETALAKQRVLDNPYL